MSTVSLTDNARFELEIEKILRSAVGQDGLRYYHVKWFDTWIQEQLLPDRYQCQVQAFWKSVHSEHVNNSSEGNLVSDGTSGQSERGRVTETSLPSNTVAVSLSTEQVVVNDTQIQEEVNQIAAKQHMDSDDLQHDSGYITSAGHQSETISVLPENSFSQTREVSGSTCPECNKTLSSRKTLRRHITLTHLKNGRFQCQICQRRFFSNHELGRHMPVHTNVKKYPCNFCGKSFKQLGHLQKHAAIHTGRKDFQCDICKRKFIQKINLQNHLVTHSEGRSHECTICGAKFKHKHSVSLHHKRRHSGSRECVCNVCDAGFQSKLQLRRHIKDVHGNILYHCDFCPRSFMIQKCLEKHVQRHKSGELPPVPDLLNDSGMDGQYEDEHSDSGAACTFKVNKEEVGGELAASLHVRSFGDSAQLDPLVAASNDESGCASNTLRTDSVKSSPHIKSVAGKISTETVAMSDESLRLHESEQGPDRRHHCQLCTASFTKQAYLNAHMESHKSKDAFLNCLICDKTFKWRQSLKNHLKQEHGDVLASAEQELRRQHSQGNKGITLDSILQAMKDSQRLQPNVNANIAKEFKCSLCDSSFSKLKFLEIHQNVHSTKTVSCSECSKTFKWESSLARHLQTKHGRQQHDQSSAHKRGSSTYEAAELCDDSLKHVSSDQHGKEVGSTLSGDVTGEMNLHHELYQTDKDSYRKGSSSSDTASDKLDASSVASLRLDGKGQTLSVLDSTDAASVTGSSIDLVISPNADIRPATVKFASQDGGLSELMVSKMNELLQTFKNSRSTPIKEKQDSSSETSPDLERADSKLTIGSTSVGANQLISEYLTSVSGQSSHTDCSGGFTSRAPSAISPLPSSSSGAYSCSGSIPVVSFGTYSCSGSIPVVSLEDVNTSTKVHPSFPQTRSDSVAGSVVPGVIRSISTVSGSPSAPSASSADFWNLNSAFMNSFAHGINPINVPDSALALQPVNTDGINLPQISTANGDVFMIVQLDADSAS